MKKAKSCPPGKYWCFTDKKCKKIPLGYHIGLRGYLYPDEDGKSNNGNGSGNGHSGNGNGGNGNGGGGGVSEMKENFKRLVKNGMTYAVMLYFRGRTYNIQLFISKLSKPTRLEVEKEVNKIYPGAVVRYFQPREFDPTNPTLMVPEEKQPGAKDLVQQSDYMKPALQQKNQTNHKKKKHSCGEEVTLKSVEEALSTKDAKKLQKASILTTSDDPKDWESARARQTDVDYKDLLRQRKLKKVKVRNESFEEDTVRVEGQFGYVEFIDIIKPEPMKGISERKLTKGEEKEKERVVKGMKKSFKGFRARYGDDAESVMYATATKLAKEEVKEGKIADALRKTIADMKAADRKAGLLPGGPDVVDLDVERERRRKKKIKEGTSIIQRPTFKRIKEQLASHIKKGVDAAKPLVRMNVSQNGVITKKEKSKPPEKKDSKSIFSQLTNKDEID